MPAESSLDHFAGRQALQYQTLDTAISLALRAEVDTQVFGLNWRPLYQVKIAARNGLDALADFAVAMAASVL